MIQITTRLHHQGLLDIHHSILQYIMNPLVCLIYIPDMGSTLNFNLMVDFLEKILTIEGLDIEARLSNSGGTALDIAVLSNPSGFDMMRMLVNTGADIEARSQNQTAACLASIYLFDKRNPPLKVCNKIP